MKSLIDELWTYSLTAFPIVEIEKFLENAVSLSLDLFSWIPLEPSLHCSLETSSYDFQLNVILSLATQNGWKSSWMIKNYLTFLFITNSTKNLFDSILMNSISK